ncbi:MAG: right-handed parallel beta-helix repeat-containing protein [Phycisphaerales bacterium]
MNARTKNAVLLAVPAFLIASAWLYAGPLNPPPGPVASTPGPEPRTAINATTTQGDPDSLFKITQPGSYYLADNITGVTGKHGIEIAASGVTLDLNGFDLAGVPGSLDGVNVSLLSAVNVSVRNGSVRAWGGSGINLTDAGTSATNVADIVASQNGIVGIRMGFGGTLTRCTAYNNTGSGIAGAAGTVITECAANTNGSHGITTGSGCTISRCTVRSNTGDGINVFGSCLVLSNSCSNNGVGAGTGAGIHALSNDNRIEGNVCTGGDFGVLIDQSGNFVTRNTCSGATNNWNIAAGNTILVVNATTAGAFAGSAGGTAPGSVDPNANFTY